MSNLSPLALTIAQTHSAGGWEAVAKLVGAWQPIETAPKDGTEIILGCARGAERWSESGFWNDGLTNYWKTPGWWSEMDRGDLLTAKTVNPTHWMPLPEPPNVG